MLRIIFFSCHAHVWKLDYGGERKQTRSIVSCLFRVVSLAFERGNQWQISGYVDLERSFAFHCLKSNCNSNGSELLRLHHFWEEYEVIPEFFREGRKGLHKKQITNSSQLYFSSLFFSSCCLCILLTRYTALSTGWEVQEGS